ncbi:MAG TPA: dienelactone hydrolase family protein, partial [Xanthobacteraceae bacterium]
IGAKDETSSPAACREMIEDARGRSALARIVVYPGADHAFDHPNDPRHALAAAPGAALPASARAVRTWDHEARADAQKRLAEWLAR